MNKQILAAGVALSVLVSPAFLGQPAMAQVPVIDQGVISATNKIAANTAEQLKRLNDIKSTTEDILEAIGKNGQGQYDLNKNESWKEFSGGGDFLKALSQFSPNLCATGACSNQDGAGEQFKDLEAARAYVMKSLYSSKITNDIEENDYRQARKNVERDANVTAYALALVARQYIADSASRAEKLDGIVNGADDVRADLKANSAVTLAQHQQLSGMLAVLTSMLERDASSYFANGEREFFSEEGSEAAPDIYKESDHLPDGTRIGIDGSASGRGKTTGTNGDGAPFGESENQGGSGANNSNNSGGASAENAWKMADSRYNSQSATSLGAAAAAAAMDGNQSTSKALEAAADAAETGDLGDALYKGASKVGKSSSDEKLKWMFESADYGMDSGVWDDAVDVGTGKKPMIDIMFDVAGDMSNARGTDKQILREAERALKNGEIDQKQAALIALRVASEASGHTELDPLLKGAGSAVKGYDMRKILIQVIKDSAGRGSTTSKVVDLVDKATR